MTNVQKVEVHKAEDHGELEEGDQWYWTGVAANGEVVVTSEMFPTASNATRSALAVFPEATVVMKDEGTDV
jgi:Domain of unknown function (DUF1508).